MFGIKDFDKEYNYAIEFASKSHGDQMYGDVPYISHLVQVSMVLVRFGFHPAKGSDYQRAISRNLIIAAILHDVIEDTPVTKEDVSSVFNDEISDLVYAVSNEPGKNRKERHKRSHHKLLEIDMGLTLKLADRIANIENCHASGSPLINMYRREWDDFRSKLHPSGKAPQIMWDYLDRLMS